jgi:putative ABC transport system ATP-binding protein
MSSSPTSIVVEDVEKSYENGLVNALKGVSFEVERGSMFGIMGPSGSGKSTLLHLLGALDTPTRGVVRLLGRALHEVEDLARLRREKLGFVFQLHHLVPNLSLRENVELPSLPLGIPRQDRRRRADHLLERVGLGDRAGFLPVKCSGGERQRAAVARALMNKPELLLADEPTGSVDSTTGASILSLFRELQSDAGLTVVMITHNESIGRQLDALVRLVDGRIVDSSGTPAPAPGPQRSS